jgi:hypothetical protein
MEASATDFQYPASKKAFFEADTEAELQGIASLAHKDTPGPGLGDIARPGPGHATEN